MRELPVLAASPAPLVGDVDVRKLLHGLDSETLVEAVKEAVLAERGIPMRAHDPASSSRSKVYGGGPQHHGRAADVAEMLLGLGRRGLLDTVGFVAERRPDVKPKLVQELERLVAMKPVLPPPPPRGSASPTTSTRSVGPRRESLPMITRTNSNRSMDGSVPLGPRPSLAMSGSSSLFRLPTAQPQPPLPPPSPKQQPASSLAALSPRTQGVGAGPVLGPRHLGESASGPALGATASGLRRAKRPVRPVRAERGEATKPVIVRMPRHSRNSAKPRIGGGGALSSLPKLAPVEEAIDEDEDLAVPSALALHEAVIRGDITEVQSLIASRADLERRDSDGRTPAALAVVQGTPHNVLQALLKAKADVTARDREGRSMLHIWSRNLVKSRAGLHQEQRKLSHLARHGAELNAALPGSGETPLHMLARVYGSLLLQADQARPPTDSPLPSEDIGKFLRTTQNRVKHLVEAGADSSRLDAAGRSPADFVLLPSSEAPAAPKSSRSMRRSSSASTFAIAPQESGVGEIAVGRTAVLALLQAGALASAEPQSECGDPDDSDDDELV